jgi:uncharacterized protein DUF4178
MRLRTVKCSQCGGTAQLREDAQTAQCRQCGTTVTLEEAKRGDVQTHLRYPNPTPLNLGMKAMLRGKEYELIGRLVLTMMEEGVAYTWNEFELLAPDGDALFLEYEEGRWKLMETFVPQQPMGPVEAAHLQPGAVINLDGTPATVTEISQATVVGVQGELTFQARVGDRMSYLDATSWKRSYAVEWREEEIEYYRGEALTDWQVFAAFGLRQELARLELEEKKRRSRLWLATACLVTSLCAFLFWSASFSSGAVVRQESVPMTSVGAQGVRFGPFTLDPGRRVHRLTIHGSMTQASAWVAGVLEGADGKELIASQGELWDESGVDDEGRWHESDLRAHTDFLVTRPGPYYVRLWVERDGPIPDPFKFPTTEGSSYGHVGYELRGGILYPAYLLTYAIIALILALIFFVAGSHKALKQMAQSSD